MKATYYTLFHPELGACPTLSQFRDDVIPTAAAISGIPEAILALMIETTPGTKIIEVEVKLPEGVTLYVPTAESEAEEVA